jgi:hypothetical protein
MKPPSENSDHDSLLDRLLADEDWHALNTTVKARAVGAVRARRRQRALLAWGGSAVAACALALTALNYFPSKDGRAPTASVFVPRSAPTYITEEQLMAYFPPGSCTIAEIDGERRFIILDPEIAAHGVLLAEAAP